MKRSMWTDGGDLFAFGEDGLPPVAHRHICHGGDGGDGQPQSSFSNSQSTNTAGPQPFIANQLQNLVGNAWGWMGNNMNAPGYFPGGTVAPQSERNISAEDTAWSRGANGLGYGLNALSKQQLADTISGKYLDPATNPAYQGWLEASFRPQAEHFRDIIAPSIDSKFIGSSRTAGGAHFDTTMRGVQDLERAQADAAAKAGLGMYQGERDKQFAGMGMLPSFQAMDYQDVASLQQAGARADSYQQRLLDDQNAKYGYDSTAQLDWYNRLAQTLQGMYPGGQTQGTSNSASYGYGGGGGGGGGVGSFLGPAMQGIGMALPFLPGFGLSDRRDKTDIEELGIDPLTGLKTYAYRYKSDPKNTPKTVGPMAQDIEKVRPDLVREIGGHKVVDMRALQPAGGLL